MESCDVCQGTGEIKIVFQREDDAPAGMIVLEASLYTGWQPDGFSRTIPCPECA